MTLQMRVLGAVEVWDNAVRIDAGHARQLCVLAVFLVEANRIVSTDQLLDRVWADRPPHRARQVVSSYVSRLRNLLDSNGAVTIERRAGGYLLQADPGSVDLHLFRSLVVQARGEDDESRALELLERAEKLWHGEAFATLDTPWIVSLREHLTLERFAATADRTDLALRLGRHASLLPQLASRAAAHPLDERVAGQYMLALYHSHRSADALEYYRRIRTRLAHDVGMDPGDKLQQLHQQILTDDPGLRLPGVPAPGPSAASRQPDPPVPHQLPADIPRFTGRARYLAKLDELSALATDRHHQPVVIALDGAAGVGKTALAVRWAHSVGHLFPDGQLYLNLRGHSADTPMRPAEAAGILLRSLGIPAGSIPSTLDERSALLRTALAGKRTLVLLDNAMRSEQIRPLLPGTGNVVLITSRNQLRSLTIREDAHRITIDPLDIAESKQLLERRTRNGAEIDNITVNRLLQVCKGLPLALAIAAERAVREPSAFHKDLIGGQPTRQGVLDVLDSAEDATTSLRTIFSWSYHTLSTQAARMFRLVGTAPGDDISVPAAAALTGLDTTSAKGLLDQLVATSHLHHKQPGRYELHDLQRAYAAECSTGQDSPEQRSAGYQRLLRWLLHTAFNARPQLQASSSGLVPLPAITDVAALTFADQRHMLEWSERERHSLIASVRLAYDEGFDDVCWQLAYATWPALFLAGAWHDALDMYRVGLAAAQRSGDRIGQAHMLDGLGNAHRFAQQHLHAIDAHRKAIELFRENDNVRGHALALSNLGASYRDAGRYEEALACCAEAYVLSQGCGEQGTVAISLRRLAETLTAAGRPVDALSPGRQCLTLYREMGHLRGEATALQALATVHVSAAKLETAINHYRAAASAYGGLGDRWYQASTLTRLGEFLSRTHRTREGRNVWQQAMNIFEELGSPRAAELRAKLTN